MQCIVYIFVCVIVSKRVYKGQSILFLSMDIAMAKAEATTRIGCACTRARTYTHTHAHAHTHTSIQPLTWQHDIKSLAHREQVYGSTVC